MTLKRYPYRFTVTFQYWKSDPKTVGGTFLGLLPPAGADSLYSLDPSWGQPVRDVALLFINFQNIFLKKTRRSAIKLN